jgi:hypothetical protein
VLAGTSCSGALGPRSGAGTAEVVEHESGASITLHLQWLPQVHPPAGV